MKTVITRAPYLVSNNLHELEMRKRLEETIRDPNDLVTVEYPTPHRLYLISVTSRGKSPLAYSSNSQSAQAIARRRMKRRQLSDALQSVSFQTPTQQDRQASQLPLDTDKLHYLIKHWNRCHASHLSLCTPPTTKTTS